MCIDLYIPCIERMTPFPLLADFPLFLQAVEQVVSLGPGKPAQFHDICPLDGAMFFDIGQYHLFLLDWVETGLPDIGSLLTGFL